jgi:thiol-disulfide isomerase/thioredoxin
MADVTKPPEVPTAVARERPRTGGAPADRGIVIDPRVMFVGGAVAILGLGVLAIFLWMVPNAAARESIAACRGLHGEATLNPALCPTGQPCTLPVPAPDFTAVDYKGNPVHLSQFRGKVVLLNFWASWCGVCRTEKPAINAMAKDLVGSDFTVIALASDRTWSDPLLAITEALGGGKVKTGESGEVPMATALAAYQQALPDGTPFQVFLDPPSGDSNIGKIAASWGITAVPESALIDRKGNIRAYFVNKRDWDSPVAETCLQSVIDE